MAGFMKRLVGETPITEEELTPVIDSLKKKGFPPSGRKT